jgi:hypothetical protein
MQGPAQKAAESRQAATRLHVAQENRTKGLDKIAEHVLIGRVRRPRQRLRGHRGKHTAKLMRDKKQGN